jgi:hypothetical protein
MNLLAHGITIISLVGLAVLAALVVLGVIGIGMCCWVGIRMKNDGWRTPPPFESVIGLVGMTLSALGWAALWGLLER